MLNENDFGLNETATTNTIEVVAETIDQEENTDFNPELYETEKETVLSFDLEAEKLLATTQGSDKKEVLSDILFDIKEYPVLVSIDGVNVPFAGQKALMNSNTGKLLSVVSDRYQPVQNDLVLEKFAKILYANDIEFKYGRGTLNRSGNKTIMELILPKHEIDIKGDKMRIHAYLINDFLGTGAVKLQLGHFRYICTNLALVKGSKEIDFRAAHLGEINSKLANKFGDFIGHKINETTKFLTDMSQGSFGGKQNVMDFIEKQEIVADRYKKEVVAKWNYNYQASDSYFGVYNTYTDVITHNVRGNDLAKMTALNALNSKFEKMLNNQAEIIEAEF